MTSPSTHTAAPSDPALEPLARLLQLEAGLTGASWMGDQLSLTVPLPTGSGTLYIELLSTGRGCYREAGPFGVSHSGDSLEPELEPILEHVAGVLEGLDPAAIEAAFPRAWAAGPDAPTKVQDAPEIAATRTPTNPRVERLADLLGLGPQIVAAEWWGDQLVMEIEGPGVDTFVAVLAKRTDDGDGYLATDHLLLCYEGSVLLPAQAAILQRLAATRPEITFDQLKRAMPWAIRVSAQEGRETTNRSGSGCATNPHGDEPISRAWHGKGLWYRFLCSAEIDRQVVRTVDLFQEAVYVEHGDLECRFALPQQRRGVPSFINYPFKPIRRQVDLADPDEPDSAFGFLTNMDDADMVLGGSNKLQEILEVVSARYPDKPIHLNCTCPPIVIADEIARPLAAIRDKHGAAVIFTTQDPGSPIPNFAEALKLPIDATHRPTDESAVNLVGFPPGPDHDELIGLLSAIGLRTNVSVIPHGTVELLERYADGAHQVFYPNGPWLDLYSRAFGDLPQTSIFAGSPFGVEGTRRWLSRIAQETGQATPEDADRAIDSHLAALGDRWTSLQRQASAHSLGFVLNPGDLQRLMDPLRNMGIPIFEILAEMGFTLEIAFYELSAGDAAACEGALEELVGDAGEWSVTAFHDEPGLWTWLTESSAAAIFSEYFYDWRLTRAGKSQLHLGLFEKGIGGAIRSAQRLVNLCRMPFYRRYGKYLERSRHV